MSLCDIKNLSKSYPSFVLSDISFELNAGRNKATHWIFYRSSQLLSEEKNQEYCCYNENFLQ